LNHPVHFVALEQGLPQYQSRGPRFRLGEGLKNSSGQGLFGHRRDLGTIAAAYSVAEEDDFADCDAQAVSEMQEHIARDRYRLLTDALRGNEKHRHVDSGESGRIGLLEERLHLIEETVAVGFHGHAAFFRVLHQQFFLSGRQFGGNFDLDRIDLIACRASLQAGNP